MSGKRSSRKASRLMCSSSCGGVKSPFSILFASLLYRARGRCIFKSFSGVFFFLFSLSLSLSCLTKIICSNIIYVNTTIVLRDIYRRTSSLSFVSLFLEKLSEQRGVAVIVILRGIRAAVDRVSSSLQVCADLGNQHVGNLFVRKFLQQSFHLRLSTSDDIY